MEEQRIINDIGTKRVRRRKKLLFDSIRDQMEFYFSDSNLSKDRFLSQLIQEDPYIDLSVFLKFNKIRNLTTNTEDICRAIRKSEILELSDDNLKVCRNTPIKQKDNQDECTIYVERLPVDAEHDWLKSIFSKFGTVDYVSIPKYKHNKMIKGFAFVEFNTPESARNVLQYFESIDCKLPTTMLPEQLISISTFEKDCPEEGKTNEVKSETSNSDKNETNSENINPKEEIINDETKTTNKDKSKKRNVTNEENVESKKKKKLDKQESDENEEEIQETESKKKKKLDIKETKHIKDNQEKLSKKKRKNEQLEMRDIQETSSKKKRKSQENVETLIESENTEETKDMEKKETKEKTENENDSEDNKNSEVVIKKKKRKQKKSHKNDSLDLQQIGLQILSKKEWKQLRNKYLNLQKQKMKNLKEQFHRNRFSNNGYNSEANGRAQKKPLEANKNEPETVPRFKYTPGTIIHLQLPDVCLDIKKFKSEVRAHTGIEYIDIETGNNSGYLRFKDNESAKKFSESSFNATMNLLTGEEEKDYWDKIILFRENKFKKDAHKKQRGRDKLLRKAEKELGKHIKFDD